MSKHKWIEKYYEISKKTPEYKREFSNNANENGYNAKVKKGQEDDADRYCKDKVVTLLRYLFYNRSMYPFSDSLQIFKPRGTMFAERRIDIGDYAMTDMLVDKTLSEKRNYEKDDTIKYIRAKYALFEAINSLFETDENYVKNDILRFYKGYFFLKESSDTFELNLEITDAFIHFMHLGYSNEYYKNYGDRYSKNKPIAIFNSHNSEEEQDLFLHLILKYDELSPKDLETLNRDHWEIIDIEWRKELFKKLVSVLLSSKWSQCRAYLVIIYAKLFHPAKFRFDSSERIINSRKSQEAKMKKKIIAEFKNFDIIEQQKIFQAIELGENSSLNEDEKKWYDIVNELDNYAEKILINQETKPNRDLEENNRVQKLCLSKKKEYENLIRQRALHDLKRRNSRIYPPWIKVSSLEENDLEYAIKNCQNDDLNNVAKWLNNYSFPIPANEIELSLNEDIESVQKDYQIIKNIKILI